MYTLKRGNSQNNKLSRPIKTETKQEEGGNKDKSKSMKLKTENR